MYLEHFKLTELPFRLSPDPAVPVSEPKHHARAKAYMESTIWFTDGFVVITGEIGSGKTTLIETFLQASSTRTSSSRRSTRRRSRRSSSCRPCWSQFGFTPFKMKKAELIATLNQFLIEQYAAGRKVLLIVDEAQNLSHKVLEEVRLLSGRRDDQGKGAAHHPRRASPSSTTSSTRPSWCSCAQRVRLRFHLDGAVAEQDTAAYIRHRLRGRRRERPRRSSRPRPSR